ncbi:MAG TPA: hypothetical protein VG869_15120 [Acidimicrobiia bacterium]|nr:hypothetical protein [Acidimicrobiia bacterium]
MAQRGDELRAEGSVRAYSLEILAVSFAALLLEISYTRVVSFKLFYYYTYLVIGLALLGIGSGGVVVATSRRLRQASTDAVLAWSFLVGAASVAIGYAIVAWISVDTLNIWLYGTGAELSAVVGLLAICLAIFASFVAVGVVVATLFARRTDKIGRLYFADLLGAGLACAVVVALIASIGPPGTIMLAGAVLAAAGVGVCLRGRRRGLAVGVVLAVVLAVLAARPSLLPEQRTDATKAHLTSANTAYSSWSPIFRVDVQNNIGVRFLYHDGLLGSGIYPFNGDPASLTRFETDPRKWPFAVTGPAPRRVLIIGAAGGNEVLTSLYYRAHHVDAIELNPVTWSLVTHTYAAYDGHLAQNPRVNFVKGDGRSYLARSNAKYQLVWFPAPDSYSATNAATASAFVLSESYLYTSNAVADSLRHLSPGGVLAVQFGEFDKPNRTLRYVATARHALAELGVRDPTRHVAVATSPDVNGFAFSTILVKRDAFTAADVARFTSALPAVGGSALRYAPDRRVDSNPVSRLITTPGSRLDAFYNSYPYDVRPITDNRPFFWHFTRFTDVIRGFGKPIDRHDFEQAVGERVLILLLGVAVLLAALFLLLPFVRIRRTWSALPRKGRSATYFALLGFGFIFFEVTLIQRLVLFLGYPTYSLTVTLMSILVFTGVGAFLSERVKDRSRRAIPVLVGAITALTLFYLLGLTPLTDALLSWPLAARIPVALAVLAPLGLCLGMFMPLGLGAVASLTEASREYVAWGWAVNGFASVIGSVLSTILAMSFGFNAVLVLALLLYLGALALLRALLPAPVPPDAEASPPRRVLAATAR